MLLSPAMLLRTWRRWLFGAALFAAGCLSPTLPLPPPNKPDVSSSSEGLVRLKGAVEPQSEVFALDRNSNLISGQYTASGNYDFTLQAVEGDSLSLWYVNGTVESPPNDFILRLPTTPTPYRGDVELSDTCAARVDRRWPDVRSRAARRVAVRPSSLHRARRPGRSHWLA